MGDTLCDVSRQTKPWGESNPGDPFVVRHRVVYKKGKRIDYCVALYKGAFRLPCREAAPCIPVSAHRFAGWRQNTGKILLQFAFLLGRHSLPLEVSKSIIDLALEFDVSSDDRFDELFDFELGSPNYRDPRLAFKE